MSQSQNLTAALDAADHGFRVFPVQVKRRPKPERHKKSAKPLVQWGSEATTDPDTIKSWWKKWPDATPGMVTGEVFVVDLDDGEGKNGTADYEALGLDPEAALFSVRTPSGGRHLYFAGQDDLTISGGKVAPGIDTRGHGGFVFAPGSRHLFGEYKVERGDLWDLKHCLLDDIPAPIQAALERAERDQPTDQPGPGEHDLETIKDALHHIPNDGSYDEWNECLMAVHHATGGSTDGLALVLGWSAGYPGFSMKDIQAKWRSYGKNKGSPITADTLFMKARQHGWNAIDADSILDDLDDEPEDQDADSAFFTDAADLLSNPAPPREWHVADWFPARTVHLMMGDGGTGKSLLALQLAVATAAGKPWIGMDIDRPGPVAYYGAEDDMDEMHRRVADVCAAAEVESEDLRGRLHLKSAVAEDSIFAALDRTGRVKPTKLLKRITRELEAVKPSLLVLDTLANLHALDPNNQEQARAFVGLLVQIAQEHDCSVLLLAHPSRTGMATGGGDGFSVGWSNSVRSRSYLRADKDAHDVRVLENLKANYGSTARAAKLVYQGGALVPVTEDYAQGEVAKRVFIELLDRFQAQGRVVNTTKNGAYAPKEFAHEPEAEGLSQAQLEAAMRDLLRAEIVAIETFRENGRDRKRLVRGPYDPVNILDDLE